MASTRSPYDPGTDASKQRSNREERRPSLLEQLRGSLSSQPFDWKKGQFEGDDSGIPLWVQLLIHLIICILILGTTILLLISNAFDSSNIIFINPSATLNWKAEILRWILFLSTGYAGFVLANVTAVLVVYATFGFYSLKKKETPKTISDFMNHMLFLRHYIAHFMAGTALWIMANILFPISENDLPRKEQGVDGKDAGSLEDTAKYMTSFMLTHAIREYSTMYSWQFFVNRSAAALMALAGLILIEKIIIERISSMFYHHAFSERIEANRFGVKTTKKLCTMITQRHPDLDGLDTASAVFQGLCPHGRTTITSADILAYLPALDAENYFALVNVDLMPELNREQFTRAVGGIFDEQERLHAAMLDQDNIIRKLDKLFIIFTLWIVALVWMTLFQVSLQGIIAALAGITAIIAALSSGTIKTAFGSIVFVIFTHPFDVGDSITIKGENYVVKELGLWSTTFLGPGKRLTYISNSTLRGETIANKRRSPFQSEVITINVLPVTPTEKIRQLEGKLQAFLDQNIRDYIPNMKIFGFTLVDKEKMKLEMRLAHRGNFQDDDLKDQRTRKFLLFLKEALAECAIQLSPPERHYYHQ